MNINEAFNILNLSGNKFTKDEIKAAYRVAASKYHPDKASSVDKVAYTEIMKAVNAAYDFLNSLEGDVYVKGETNFYDYSQVLYEALQKLLQLDRLNIEVLGNWIWIGGDTRTHKEVLKEMRCRWAPKKKLWYFRPDEWKAYNKGNTLSIDEIRAKYGNGKGTFLPKAKKTSYSMTTV